MGPVDQRHGCEGGDDRVQDVQGMTEIAGKSTDVHAIEEEWRPDEPNLLIALILSVHEGKVTLGRMVRLMKNGGPVDASMRRHLKGVLENATARGFLRKNLLGRYTVTHAGRLKEQEMMAELIKMTPMEYL